MSDCSKCLETPCMCGEGYRKWSSETLQIHIAILTKILKEMKLDSNDLILNGLDLQVGDVIVGTPAKGFVRPWIPVTLMSKPERDPTPHSQYDYTLWPSDSFNGLTPIYPIEYVVKRS